MKVLNEFPNHHYFDEYEKCDLFCPNCGIKEVWQEQSSGDYYVGEDFICVACKHNFTIQGPVPIYNLKKIEQLKSGVTLKPSTPIGG